MPLWLTPSSSANRSGQRHGARLKGTLNASADTYPPRPLWQTPLSLVGGNPRKPLWQTPFELGRRGRAGAEQKDGHPQALYLRHHWRCRAAGGRDIRLRPSLSRDQSETSRVQQATTMYHGGIANVTQRGQLQAAAGPEDPPHPDSELPPA